MAVKIRFARIGRKKRPVYRIVAIDSREKRDGAALECLGTYDPLAEKLLQYHAAETQRWISSGAIVTDAVKRIIRLHGRSVTIAAAPVSASVPE